MIHTLRLFIFSIWDPGENFLVSANIADKLPFLKAVLVVVSTYVGYVSYYCALGLELGPKSRDLYSHI